jgi:hypothetical protein
VSSILSETGDRGYRARAGGLGDTAAGHWRNINEDMTAVTRARIYQPSRTAMQSGRGKTGYWLLEFEPGARKVNDPLMGWVGCADTRNQVRMRFPTQDEAVAFAERNGLTYVVEKPAPHRTRPKSYAETFFRLD